MEPFVGTREDLGFNPRAYQQTLAAGRREYQQTLATSPFGNTCEADAVLPEAAMRGLQEKDVYNQGEYQVDRLLE
jgi:hypothetical protein